MLILFLDTETTSLQPSSGQIIEIAGIVVDFDTQTLNTRIESEFSTLVGLRQEMEERITRLTGITQEDLQTAPNLIKAQDQWANWVEQYNIEAVCGHNIDFDTDFIKNESWYLPSSFKRIDTVELSKILLPHAAAVNLEYLSKKRYQMNTSGWDDTVSGETVQNQTHRALDDARMCLQLFNRLIQDFVEFPFDSVVQNYILEHFLPLPIIVYSHEVPATLRDTPIIQRKRSWFGRDEMSIHESLHIITYSDIISVHKMLIGTPSHIGLILVQIIAIRTIKKLHPDWKLRFHTFGSKNFIIFNLVAAHLASDQNIESVNILPAIEDIVWNVGSFFEDEFAIGNCMWIADLLFDLRQDETDVSIIQFISSYHFFEISLQSLWQKSEYTYNPQQMRPEEGIVKSRLIECLKKLEVIDSITLKDATLFENILLTQLKKLIRQCSIDSNVKHTFRNKKGSISICTYQPKKVLTEYIVQRIAECDSKIISYLSPAHLNSLMLITGLKELLIQLENTIEYYSMGDDIEVKDHVNLDEFIASQLELAQLHQSPVILLAGQNSTLKDVERVLIDQFDHKDFLVIGESGSITKITSKLLHTFSGIVCIKSGDLAYIIQQITTQFHTVWQVNKPYFYIHYHWRTYCKQEQLDHMKKLHLYSKLGQMKHYNRGAIGYVKSY